MEVPDFQAADVAERVKLVQRVTHRCYNMTLLYGGDVIGLSGGGGKDRHFLIQNVINELRRGGAEQTLRRLASMGRPVSVQDASLLSRTADVLGRKAQGFLRRLKRFDRNRAGVYLGLDLGREKIKTFIMKDGKALFKGMFPSGIGRDGEPSDSVDQESLGRAVQNAASKTVDIGSRSLGSGCELSQTAVVLSRSARPDLLREPRWVLEALHRKLGCPVWLHTDREAQALACAAMLEKNSLCAVSLGFGMSVGLLQDGLPVLGPLAVEYFWENTTKDCVKGSSLAFLNARTELAVAARKGFKSAIERLDTTEINQAAADKKHVHHYRAFEVILDMAKHLAWNLVELHGIFPFECAVLTGARTSQVGELLVEETGRILKRLDSPPKLELFSIERKMNPALTGAYGAALLACAHKCGVEVGGESWKLFSS